MRRNLFFFILLILYSATFAHGSAMGMTPASHREIFVGQDVISHEFTVIPTEEKNIKIYPEQDLTKYVFFDNNESEFKVHLTGPQSFQYFLRLPKDLKPGNYRIQIMAEQYFTPEEKIKLSGSAFGVAAVGYVLFLRVPEKDKFLEASLHIEPEKINVGDPAYLIANLLNFGRQDLLNLKTDFHIRTPEGVLVANRETALLDVLPAGQSGQLKAYWDTKGQKAGIYPVESIIEYGGDAPAKLEGSIRIGDIFVKIQDIRTELNESVGKIFVDVESNWNEAIPNVYAEISVKNRTGIVHQFKTSAIDLQPWGQGTLLGYWERQAFAPGDYTLDIAVHYADKLAKKEKKIRLSPIGSPSPQSGMSTSTLLLIVVGLLAIMILINIFLSIYFFKGRSNKKK